MSKKLGMAVFYSTVIFVMSTFSGFGQDLNLKEKRVTLQMDQQPLGTIFRFLMETYDVPIAFEQSVLDRDHSDYSFQTNLPFIAKERMRTADDRFDLEMETERSFAADKHPITVKIENGRLGEVLDKIVNQMENYSWEINADVVNIFPIRGRDERFKALLETNVKSFSLEKGQTVEEITFRLMRLPEFGGWLSRNKLQFNGFRMGSESLVNAQYRRKLESSMSFANIRFRDLLNQITKRKKGGWILRSKRVANGEEHIDLDI